MQQAFGAASANTRRACSLTSGFPLISFCPLEIYLGATVRGCLSAGTELKLKAAEKIDESFEVAVIAADEALGASLVLLLAASGICSASFARPSDLPVRPPGARLILADWSVLVQDKPNSAEAVKGSECKEMVIVMTEDDQVPLAGSDFDAFLAKPFAAEDVLNLITEVVYKRSNRITGEDAGKASSGSDGGASAREATAAESSVTARTRNAWLLGGRRQARPDGASAVTPKGG